MSLKPKASKKDLLEKLKEGQIVKGTIQRIKDFGIFVQLQHSSLVGFVHKSLISDQFVKDISELYKVGQGRQRNADLHLVVLRDYAGIHNKTFLPLKWPSLA